MLGKRTRQIQRTTSMSQLGRPYLYAEQTLDRRAPPPASATNSQPRCPNSSGFSQKIARPSGGTQDQQIQIQIVDSVMGDAASGVSLEHDTIMLNSLQYVEGIPAMQQSLSLDVRGQSCSLLGRETEESSHVFPESGLWVPFMGSVPWHPLHSKSEAVESIRPVDFLEFCFFCKRRLAHEKDIFIYRGDIAFCSEDCRNHLIASEERHSTSTSQKRSSGRNGKLSETAVAA